MLSYIAVSQSVIRGPLEVPNVILGVPRVDCFDGSLSAKGPPEKKFHTMGPNEKLWETLSYIIEKILNWYGHGKSTDETRWINKIIDLSHMGMRK